MAKSPYPIDPDLTAIAIAYMNADYIADIVAPRIRVGKQDFKFLQYDDMMNFNIPDTLVGRKGRTNQIELSATEVSDSTQDHGLEDGVPNSDIGNADVRYDPLGIATTFLQSQIALKREARVAAITFNQATYQTGYKATLAGASQFSDPTSDPIGVISLALDVPLRRPNQIVFSQAGWTKFRAHPKIVSACLGNNGVNGLVTRQQVSELLEIREVLVGQSRGNAAKRGQPGALQYLWGKHIALLYKPEIPTTETPGFMSTFEWGDRVSMQWEDRNIGLEGGIMVRTGERLKERVVASLAGYFFENAFA